MSDVILCRACGNEESIDKFGPCLSPYQDIRCPSCGSTDNEHNEKYQKRLFAKMRGKNGGSAGGPVGEAAQDAYDRDLSRQDAEDDKEP